jgi:hypothetical protein
MMDVSYDADNLTAERLAQIDYEMLSDWVLLGKELLCQSLVDDYHVDVILVVGIGEVPALDERNAQRSEVIGACLALVGVRTIAWLQRRPPFDSEGRVVVLSG